MKLSVLFPLAVLAAALGVFPASAGAAAAPAPAPIRVLLVAGGCCHDYAAQRDILKRALEERAHVAVDVLFSAGTTTRTVFPEHSSPDWAKGYDVIFHAECSADVTDAKLIENVLAPHRQGVPAVLLHCAMHSFRTEGWNTGGITPWYEFTGIQTSGHGPQAPIDLNFFDQQNEITKGMTNWTTTNEELYNTYAGGLLPTAKPLVLGRQGGTESALVWTNLYREKAKVFGTTLGHNTAMVADPRLHDLLARGLLWTVGKLNDTYLKTPAAPAGATRMSGLAEPATGEKTEAVAEGCGCQDGTALALAD